MFKLSIEIEHVIPGYVWAAGDLVVCNRSKRVPVMLLGAIPSDGLVHL